MGLLRIASAGRRKLIGGRVVTVANQTQLNAAIAALLPDDNIQILPNVTPYALDLSNVQSARYVRLSGKAGEASPVFSQIKLNNCRRFILDGLVFDGDPSGVATDFYMFHGINCQYITLVRSSWVGNVYTYFSGTGNRAPSGIRMEGTSNFLIDDCYVGGVCWAIRLFSCTDGIIRESTLEWMQMDGIQFVNHCARILFDYNKVGSPSGSPHATNHGDLVQFTNSGNTVPMTDIMIRNSIFATLGQAAYQMVFLNDEVGVGYQRIQYLNNILFGNNSLGLVIRSCSDCEIRNNILLRDEAAFNPGVGTIGAPAVYALQGLLGITNLAITNNISEAYIGMSETGVTASGNITSTSGQRNARVPGILSMNDLADFDGVVLPNGYGPLRMQAP